MMANKFTEKDPYGKSFAWNKLKFLQEILRNLQ